MSDWSSRAEAKCPIGEVFLSKMVVFLRFSFIFTNDSTYDYEQVGKEPVS